jgi:repressor LexA
MSDKLTKGQAAVLAFIRRFTAENGYSPTDRDIQAGMGFKSSSTARHHLAILERKRVIQRQPGKARGIVLPESRSTAGRPLISIPLLGGITAGLPVEAIEQFESCIMVDAHTLRLPMNAKTFALKVRGDSMTGVSILDGDYVIMEFRDPKPGDIVAALIDGETTLKTYIIRRGRPCLRAENPRYPDIIPGQELVIQGVMVAVLRVPQAA